MFVLGGGRNRYNTPETSPPSVTPGIRKVTQACHQVLGSEAKCKVKIICGKTTHVMCGQ